MEEFFKLIELKKERSFLINKIVVSYDTERDLYCFYQH